jgi:hypothetical protein
MPQPKYAQHGLTLNQDRVLGAFGLDDEKFRTVVLEELGYVPDLEALRQAATQLVHKGLLKADTREDGTIEYTLTRTGAAL